MVEITVIIPVRDDVRLDRCLRSFDDERAKALVVLNDPTEAVRRIVRDRGVNSITIPTAGPAKACEAGVRASTTNYVLSMDSDCVFVPGSLARFINAVGEADFVRGVTIFRHHNWLERIVAKTRVRHTNNPDMVYRIPLMFDRRVQSKIGGYIFDDRLIWTEDYDLSIRIRQSECSVIRINNAVAIHDALSVKQDLRSAYRYGFGHRKGVALNLAGYHKLKPWKSVSGVIGAMRQFTIAETIYGLLWNVAFCCGYYFTNTTD